MARKCFYSFHYKPDNSRAGQVRNIGVLEGNTPVSDNDWETVTGKGDAAIEKWIKDQMHGRTCTVVLVGEKTAARKWITHEIVKSWEAGMGVVCIRIHGLKNLDGYIAKMGGNPLNHITVDGVELSPIVKCYNPKGDNSKERYAWISEHLENAVEEAVRIRKAN